MIAAVDEKSGMLWLLCSLLTVFCFGLYGNLLHTGQLGMKDPKVGRYKAFLMVGFAYFVVAVLLPALLLIPVEGGFDFTLPGVGFSLVAGSFGAVGAFGILLAFGARGTPVVVMSIVFAGAPIVNAIFSIFLHPPAGGISSISPMFFLGILLAAVGGGLVTFYKPPPSKARPVKPTEPKFLPPSELARLLDKINTPQGKKTRLVRSFPEQG